MSNTEIPKTGWNWFRIALRGSLAVNLLVGGLILGAILGFEPGKLRYMERVSNGLGLYIRALPEAHRASIQSATGLRDIDRKKFVRDLRENRRKMEEILLARPFSETAVRNALKDHRMYISETTVTLQEAFIDVLAGFSEQEREEYFAQVEELRDKREKHHKGKRWWR